MSLKQTERLRPVLIFSLVLVSFGLIAGSGVAAWQCIRSGMTVLDLRCYPADPSLFNAGLPLFIALGFWGVGLVTWLANQEDTTVFFFLAGADVLAAGLLSAFGSSYGKQLFYLLLAWLAPLTFHFHYKLLTASPGRSGPIILRLLYGLAGAWSLPFLAWDITALRQHGWLAGLQIGVRLTLALALVLAVLVLAWNYRRNVTARRHIRLITFGTLFAFTPLLLLSLLPDTLGMPVYIPYELTFPWLLLSPLAYGYSLFRHRLVRAEASLNRAAVYYLLITLLLSLYLVIEAMLNLALARSPNPWPLTSALVGVSLVLLFAPLQQSFQKLVNWVLYGSEISYTGVVGNLAEKLAIAVTRETLQELLVHDLIEAMHLQGGVLFLRQPGGEILVQGKANGTLAKIDLEEVPVNGRLAAYLAQAGRPVSDRQVRRALAIATLQPGEQQLWSALPEIAAWLPLVTSTGLQGILVLGPRRGDEFLTIEDGRILATLAHQAGVTAHNIYLLEEVWAGRNELAHAHHQLLMAREQERRRLAHELHDGAVQQLLGINYQLADSEQQAQAEDYCTDPQAVELLMTTLAMTRRDVLDIVQQLRRLISDLRPAGLEELGLTAALEGYVSGLNRESGPEAVQVETYLAKIDTTLPEPVALCLFRIAQEALRNALKHAQARCIKLDLYLLDDEVVLRVEDDGCGFAVPTRLSELTQRDHFGLVTMNERVNWVRGQLSLQSRPGRGTEVVVRLPRTR